VDARGSGTVEATPDDELVEPATQATEVETKKEKMHELEALHLRPPTTASRYDRYFLTFGDIELDN
jgi:hypothetical protein